MRQVKVDLMLVPTAGLDAETAEPTDAGKARNEVAAKSAATAIAMIGGNRLSGPTEAMVHYRHFIAQHPDMSTRVVIVSASSTTTNRDLADALPKIDQFLHSIGKDRATAVIGITSYPRHMDRMEYELKSFGFCNIERFDSEEPQAYSDIVEQVFVFITILDPAWRWLGWPLVLMSRVRLREVVKE